VKKPNQRIVLISGKGGVGKSTIAAALAYQYAKKGKKVLLVEMGERSFYQKFFGLPRVDQTPVSIAKNLEVARWSTESCLREYVLHYVKVEKLYQMFFENKVMKAFIRAAPTVSEIALLGKLTSGLRGVGPTLDYDYIFVDAYATGHFLALLRAPKGMSEAVKAGPFGEQTTSIYRFLTDPNHSHYVIVSLAESLPLVETKELYDQLRSDFDVQPEIVCNKIWQTPLSMDEIKSLESKSEPKSERHRFIHYLSFVMDRQKKYLEELRRINGRLVEIPAMFEALNNLELVEKLSQHVELQWPL
jgi:anion-transporting  ArsA/GET3 family ATPase